MPTGGKSFLCPVGSPSLCLPAASRQRSPALRREDSGSVNPAWEEGDRRGALERVPRVLVPQLAPAATGGLSRAQHRQFAKPFTVRLSVRN